MDWNDLCRFHFIGTFPVSNELFINCVSGNNFLILFMNNLLIPSWPVLRFDLLCPIIRSISSVVHGLRKMKFGFEPPVRKSRKHLSILGIFFVCTCPFSAKTYKMILLFAYCLLFLVHQFWMSLVQKLCYVFDQLFYIICSMSFWCHSYFAQAGLDNMSV
jgi:hypothetical protein